MKRAPRILLGVAFTLLAAAGLGALLVLYLVPRFIRPAIQYPQADALFAAGQYERAAEAFEALGEYGDSRERAAGCAYAIRDDEYAAADALFQSGRFEEAMDAFAALGDHRDSADRVAGCQLAILDRAYDEAAALLEAGRYEEAQRAFEALGDHRDSPQRVLECQLAPTYAEAFARYKEGGYAAALMLFGSLGDFRDSRELADGCCQACFAQAQEALDIHMVPKALKLIWALDGASLTEAQQAQRQELLARCGRILEDQEDYAGAFDVYRRSGLSAFEADMARCNEVYRSEPHLLQGSKKNCVKSIHWQYARGNVIFTVSYAAKTNARCFFCIYAGTGHKDKYVGMASRNKTELTFSIPYGDIARAEDLRTLRLEFRADEWKYWKDYILVIARETLAQADRDLYGEPLP